MYSQQTFLSNGPPHIVHSYCSYCSCALEWWDVRTPGAILNVFDFLDYTYFKISISLIGERAKRARHSQVCSIENRGYILLLEKWFPLWGERVHSLKLFFMYDKRFEI